MNKNLNSSGVAHAYVALIGFIAICVIFCSGCYAGEKLKLGKRYTITRPVYLIAAYKNLNNRQLSRETAYAYLSSKENAKRVWIAFQCEVPAGTTMTIVAPAPKNWHLPFSPARYFVKLEPDLSRGLDVEIELSRGIEGNLDGLNPELFSRQ